MNLLDRIRPRWKHSDPQVRRDAVNSLNDQAVLEQLFEGDDSAEVRAAAFARITDQDYLAELAKGSHELNVRAAERLTDPISLAGVARSADSPTVRAAAVERIDDDELLQRIASMDLDADVRLAARRRHDGPDRMREYLKNTLSKLHVAQRKAECVAEFCGTLDDVCGALSASNRYRINGVVADPSDMTLGAGLKPDFSCIEFLAGDRGAQEFPSVDVAQRVVYRIKIWRQGENDFGGAVEESRYEMSSNTLTWSNSLRSR